jgi:aerobic-type carbon monoxide dehydrogenase small subunit (CoxS/CutS family)
MPEVTFTFAGRTIRARSGQSIGAALWAAGIRRFRDTRRLGRPRGIYCGIGQCFDCLVRVNGGPPVRACITAAADEDDVTYG